MYGMPELITWLACPRPQNPYHNHTNVDEHKWAISLLIFGACFGTHKPFDPNKQFRSNQLMNPYLDNLICAIRCTLAAGP